MEHLLKLETYEEHERYLPSTGKFIIAQFNTDSVVVYQGFKASIAGHAVENTQFGGNDYDFSRNTCLKPSFLWMMHYSGWAKNKDQENILAIRMMRSGFEELLQLSSSSACKDVSLDWEAYHDLQGMKSDRKAARITISGEILQRFNNEWIISIQDITPFVQQQQDLILANKMNKVKVPVERAYAPADLSLLRKLDATTISL
jgi:hypothetical protein